MLIILKLLKRGSILFKNTKTLTLKFKIKSQELTINPLKFINPSMLNIHSWVTFTHEVQVSDLNYKIVIFLSYFDLNYDFTHESP